MYYPGYLGKRFLTTPLQAFVFWSVRYFILPRHRQASPLIISCHAVAHAGQEAPTQHSLHLVGIQVEIPIGDLSTRQDEVQAQVNVRNQKIQLAEARQTVKKS